MACTPSRTRRTATTPASRELQLPTVLVNASIEGLGFPRVSCDDAVAVEQALGHLLSLGHTRVGVLAGPADHVPSNRKVAAAQAVAKRAGVTLGADQVARSWYSIEGAQAGAAKLIEAGVTGIVCASDLMALGAIRAARRAGKLVPGDVSVVGFDDSFLMNCTEPPLTTVRQPIEPMCRMVIELLVAQVAGAPIPGDELLFEPELVVRGSTAPAPAGVPIPA